MTGVGGALDARSTLSPESRRAQTSADTGQCPVEGGNTPVQEPRITNSTLGLETACRHSETITTFVGLTNWRNRPWGGQK